MPINTVMTVEDDPLLRLDAATMFEEAGLHIVDMDIADDALATTLGRSSQVAAIFIGAQKPGHADGLYLAKLGGPALAARHRAGLLRGRHA